MVRVRTYITATVFAVLLWANPASAHETRQRCHDIACSNLRNPDVVRDAPVLRDA